MTQEQFKIASIVIDSMGIAMGIVIAFESLYGVTIALAFTALLLKDIFMVFPKED